MSRRSQGLVALGLLGLAAAVLIVELARRADVRGVEGRRPCEQRRLPGEGFQATLQRIVLDGLDGAACELNTTREELVLSIDPSWPRRRVGPRDARARRPLRPLRGDQRRPGAAASAASRPGIMREVVQRAPLDWLIQGGSTLADLLGGIFDRR